MRHTGRDGISPSFFYVCRSVHFFSCGLSGARTHHQTLGADLGASPISVLLVFFHVVLLIDCKKKKR